jgi:hypothetical protein
MEKRNILPLLGLELRPLLIGKEEEEEEEKEDDDDDDDVEVGREVVR